jgi:hypothetical protein
LLPSSESGWQRLGYLGNANAKREKAARKQALLLVALEQGNVTRIVKVMVTL